MTAYRKIIAAKGNWGTVECVRCLNGGSPAKEFLQAELGDDAAVFFALFDEVAQHGRTNNPDRFSKEDGQIYGFKHKIKNKQVRFACFQRGNIWILTHGFWKPGAQVGRGKWPKKEIDRANRLMEEYDNQNKQAKK